MNNQYELDALLKQMADDHRPQLPSPGLIWWRAQILKKQKEKERIERPLIIMRGVAAATCLVALVVLLIANWGQLQGATFGAIRLLMPLLIIALPVSVVSAFLMSRWPKSSS
jgi:hypothetical protein